MLDVLNKLKQVKAETLHQSTKTTYPQWVDDAPDSLSKNVYDVISNLYDERKAYIKGHSKMSHYGPGTKGHWQLTKISIARLVGYEVSSQVFVEKPFSKALCTHFDEINEKLLEQKDKKFSCTGFRNQTKEVIADDYSLLRKQHEDLKKSKTSDLLDASLKAIPIEVLEKLGLYSGPKSVK